jgi:hypothetical protein
MHFTRLKHNGWSYVGAGSEFRVPTPQTFAIDACAAGRYVLQLGSGQSDVTFQLKRKLCHVTAINPAAKQGRERSTSPFVAPRLPRNAAWFDQILLMDLIEHLDDAETFLSELRRKMARRGSEVIITVSNVGCCVSRMMRAFSPFNLRRVPIPAIAKSPRLFTLKSLHALLGQTGYEIVEVRGLPAPFPMTMGDTRWSRALLRFNQLLLRISKRLFAYQICVRVRPSLTYVRRSPEQTVAEATALRPQMLRRVA